MVLRIVLNVRSWIFIMWLVWTRKIAGIPVWNLGKFRQILVVCRLLTNELSQVSQNIWSDVKSDGRVRYNSETGREQVIINNLLLSRLHYR